MNFKSLFRKLAIDLGTTRTRIWHDELGVVLDEATCIAVDERVHKVVAVGDEAFAMKGRVARHISVYTPIENGLIKDKDVLQALVKALFQKVIPKTYFFRPVVMVSVAAMATDVDRQVLTDVIYAAGAGEVYLMSQSLAAVIGADVPIADASGSFVLHLSGGIAEAGVISFGGLVESKSSTYAGTYLDSIIVDQVKETQEMVIGTEVAERIKKKVVSLDEGIENSLLVTGQDLVENAPKEVEIDSQSIRPAVLEVADTYVELMQDLLESIPAELTSDVIDKGMLMTGGLSQLSGLDAYLVEKLGLSVSLVEQPDRVVIKGLATALEHLDLFKESLGYGS